MDGPLGRAWKITVLASLLAQPKIALAGADQTLLFDVKTEHQRGAAFRSAGQPAEKPAVAMTLQSVTLTNSPWQTGSWQAVVFVVTNGGAKPVHLSSCGASFIPTNIVMGLGLFGSCDVPPLTNSTLTVLWKPSHPGTQWFRYAVFERPGVFWKATTTARALEDAALAKRHVPNGWLSTVWSTNGWVPAYEIASPPFAALPEPPVPASDMGPETWPEPLSEGIMTSDDTLWSQPITAPNAASPHR